MDFVYPSSLTSLMTFIFCQLKDTSWKNQQTKRFETVPQTCFQRGKQHLYFPLVRKSSDYYPIITQIAIIYSIPLASETFIDMVYFFSYNSFKSINSFM